MRLSLQSPFTRRRPGPRPPAGYDYLTVKTESGYERLAVKTAPDTYEALAVRKS